jgi:hypothetical protein
MKSGLAALFEEPTYLVFVNALPAERFQIDAYKRKPRVFVINIMRREFWAHDAGAQPARASVEPPRI